MEPSALRYAGFWPRLASLLLDGIIMMPLVALMFWGTSQSRLFTIYYFVPSIVIGLFFHVYLVQRYGGTPGKLMAGITICKFDGTPVGYREAFLRHLPQLLIGIFASIALIVPLLQMSDAEYHSLAFVARHKRLAELAPAWSSPVRWVQNIWVWGELIVLLTNRKRRALHDFIAGTVVMKTSSIQTQ